MPILPRPSSTNDWTVGNPNFGTVTVEPTSGKKETGWTPGEPPPNQIMNWLFYNADQWIKYLDSASTALQALAQPYAAIVGTGPGATHATLEAALADVAVPSGSEILIISSETVNVSKQVTKNEITVRFKPGITYSKGSVATCLQVTANGFKVYGGRFAGFSTVGNKAIQIDSGSLYTMVRDVRFASCDTEVNDQGTDTSILGTITE